MKNFKLFPLFIAVLFLCFPLSAEDFELPDYSFNDAEDYKTYEEDVIRGINWLNNTPLDKHQDKRMSVNLFLMEWLTGVPYVTIEINSEVLPFMGNGSNPELLMTFMGGWTLFALENPDLKDDMTKCVTAGLTQVIEYYRGDNAVRSDDEVERLAEYYDNGSLEQWVSDRLN